ncbi:MAG: uracil-DNA glycosylase family protein [Alphaproteobacteria bacterium]|nr:uracil-DNA glycosylase family protein [Alphaproteobacteria bacterium]
MQLTHLHKAFDKLQKKYGSAELDSIYGAGCVNGPEICFIFMNPTGKNVASAESWKGLKAPWIGTKNTWKLFNAIGILSNVTLELILSKKPNDWDYRFAEQVYREIADKKVYITNLGKCTKADASYIKDSVFKEYVGLLEQEVAEVKPKKIITFGNQVSSLFLGKAVKVSELRKQFIEKEIAGNKFKVFPVYYPVGQGMRNIDKAIEDISFAIKTTK